VNTAAPPPTWGREPLRRGRGRRRPTPSRREPHRRCAPPPPPLPWGWGPLRRGRGRCRGPRLGGVGVVAAAVAGEQPLPPSGGRSPPPPPGARPGPSPAGVGVWSAPPPSGERPPSPPLPPPPVGARPGPSPAEAHTVDPGDVPE
jgi:hypothetical protein